MRADIPLWLQLLIAALLLLSAVCALTAAWGIVRLPNTFLRLHPTALAYTGASWSVCLACILAFSAAGHTLDLRAWIILVLLALTAPVTTTLLARATLFRARLQAANAGRVPAALQPLRPREAARAEAPPVSAPAPSSDPLPPTPAAAP